MQGKVLNERYAIIEKIGEGGMSTVFKAKDIVLDRTIAVKILKDDFKSDNNFIHRFKTEALSAARLSHSNIVNIYDVGQEGDDYYIVMEYIEGRSLASVIAEQERMEQKQACEIAMMICDGVQHAHERGVIHRDIKPHNILITTEGLVKVADFGIARAVSAATITYGNNIVGSVHYISPEQAKGLPTDCTADIYSIGCVLYEMLTGKVPFNAESPITVALKHIHDTAVEPRLLNNAIAPEVEAVVMKAMEKQPQARFASAVLMRNALMRALGNNAPQDYPRANWPNYITTPDQSGGEEAEEMPEAPIPKKKRGSLPGILIALGLLGLLIGVAVSLLGGEAGGFFGKEVAVPNLIDKEVKAAEDELSKLGLSMSYDGEEFSEEIDAGKVVRQDPSPERIVKVGREVKIVVSQGSEMVEVPNLIGKDVAAGGLLLKNAGLELGETAEAYHDTMASGLIIIQTPTGGKSAAPASTVDVTVSRGKKPKPATAPNLVGKKKDAAAAELKELGLDIGTIKEEGSTAYYEGVIIQQSVEAGAALEQGSSINIVVSAGPGPPAEPEPSVTPSLSPATQTINLTLPAEGESYEVTIWVNDGHGQRLDSSRTYDAGTALLVNVTHYGAGTADVYLNGAMYRSFELK